MSFWVKLLKDGGPVEVSSFEEGGTYLVGGCTEAVLNVTYNYSKYYYKYLDGELGLRWLHNKIAGDCIERMEKAVNILGVRQQEGYWAETPGNAGHALSLLLGWAKQHPDAKFRVN